VFFDEKVKALVVQHLTVDRWSPELISKCCGENMVSHERIYQWIWECKHTNWRAIIQYKKLYEYLRHGKRRRKRGNRNDTRGVIQNRVPIEKRPAFKRFAVGFSALAVTVLSVYKILKSQILNLKSQFSILKSHILNLKSHIPNLKSHIPLPSSRFFPLSNLLTPHGIVQSFLI
jgi:hypothetical protein